MLTMKIFSFFNRKKNNNAPSSDNPSDDKETALIDVPEAIDGDVEQTVEVLAEFLAALDEHFDPDPFRD